MGTGLNWDIVELKTSILWEIDLLDFWELELLVFGLLTALAPVQNWIDIRLFIFGILVLVQNIFGNSSFRTRNLYT